MGEINVTNCQPVREEREIIEIPNHRIISPK